MCPLPLLGCLHGGGWWDFLWIQRWCYRYNQHERGGPAPDCCVRKLRQVWISLKLTVFTSGCVQREVFVLCFCFIIHILQTKPIYTFFSFLIFVSIFQATKMIPYLDTVSDYIYGISAQALKWAVKLRPRWKNVKTLCRPEVFWKRQTWKLHWSSKLFVNIAPHWNRTKIFSRFHTTEWALRIWAKLFRVIVVNKSKLLCLKFIIYCWIHKKPLNRTWLQISKEFKLLILIHQVILFIHALRLGQCHTLTSWLSPLIA